MSSVSYEDRVLGCLLGGAVGDALGEPVEFMSLDQIRRLFGADGVRGWWDRAAKPGAVSDDTQMTLFTAEGMIIARLNGTDPIDAVGEAYLRWLRTQRGGNWDNDGSAGWLLGVPELWARRAPGTTCLSALQSGRFGSVAESINNSKGCGGVMRVAPVGLAGLGSEESFTLGCEFAAITHGHPSGYLASGALALIIHSVVDGVGLDDAVDLAVERASGEPDGDEVMDALRTALALADKGSVSASRVEQLGQGWVAEEALAISVYCAMVAEDFRHGVLLAVNHSGDSDSTGSITGQILGTMWGVDAIPSEWLEGVELRETIEKLGHEFHETFGEGR